MKFSETEILKIFEQSKALLTGHFLLTSGRHSDKYFQCAKVLQYPEYTEILCRLIAERFKNEKIDTVIAPAIGGLVVGQEVARQLNKRFIFAEREDKKLSLRRGFTIEKGYDEKFGARPLRRAIQNYVEDPLAEEILRHSFKDGTRIVAKHVEGADSLIFYDQAAEVVKPSEETEKTDKSEV